MVDLIARHGRTVACVYTTGAYRRGETAVPAVQSLLAPDAMNTMVTAVSIVLVAATPAWTEPPETVRGPVAALAAWNVILAHATLSSTDLPNLVEPMPEQPARDWTVLGASLRQPELDASPFDIHFFDVERADGGERRAVGFAVSWLVMD